MQICISSPCSEAGRCRAVTLEVSLTGTGVEPWVSSRAGRRGLGVGDKDHTACSSCPRCPCSPCGGERSLVAVKCWQDYRRLPAESCADRLRVASCSDVLTSLSYHEHPLLVLSHAAQCLKLCLLWQNPTGCSFAEEVEMLPFPSVHGVVSYLWWGSGAWLGCWPCSCRPSWLCGMGGQAAVGCSAHVEGVELLISVKWQFVLCFLCFPDVTC